MQIQAFLIATGQELLVEKTDTNTLFIAQSLSSWGVEVVGKAIVGDTQASIAAAMCFALQQANLIICSGGLGPTFDDVTRDALAQISERSLQIHPEARKQIEAFFHFRQVSMPENNIRQALLPEGSHVIPNPNGSAPGVWLEIEDKIIILVPGPPNEMKPMLQSLIQHELAARFKLVERPSVNLKIQTCGIGESLLAERLGEILTKPPEGIRMGIFAHLGQVTVEAKSLLEDPVLAKGRLQLVKDQVYTRASDYVFGYGEDTLEQACHQLLLERGLILAVAESCTGGWLSKTITDLPGSSTYFWGGLCTYDNQAKKKILGVAEEHLCEYGAVSKEVAQDMAVGLKELSNADITIAITGIAGPGGGSAEKPVGTVYISLMQGEDCQIQHHIMIGNRDTIRKRTVITALSWLWQKLKQGSI